MALIARAAMQIPDFRTITMTKHYAFPGKAAAAGGKRSTYQISTENRLLRHNYPGIAGGKTGFTSLAHRTFWATATRGGHTLVVTLFQIHEPTEAAARKLLNWGFANGGKVTPVGTLVAPLAAGSTAPAGAPSSSAVGGGTTASGGTTAAASSGIPWKRVASVVLVVALAAVLFLWWRRRRPAGGPPLLGSHEPVAPVAAAPVGTTPVPPVEPATDAVDPAPPEKPQPPAAARPAPGGNVRIVSPPGRPPTD
jgi:D-alanyl-D-alanine carboxypeptidase (penicillin-binding protein 5/6)